MKRSQTRQAGIRTATLLLLALLPAAAAAGMPTGFVANHGQLDEEVLYYAPVSLGTVFVTGTAIVLDLHEAAASSSDPSAASPWIAASSPVEEPHRACAVWIRFNGAPAGIDVDARGGSPARYNFFQGNDPTLWRTDVPAYSEVVYQNPWPGVDLRLRENGGRITYEVVAAAPSGNPESVDFTVTGPDAVERLQDGSLLIETAVGSFVLFPREDPESLEGPLFAVAGGSDGTRDAGWDKDNPNVLVWSTFLGGTDWDVSTTGNVALDETGRPIVTGETRSLDFPTTEGAYDESHNGGLSDLFVSQLSASGDDLLWSTFLGGDDEDLVDGLIVDSEGNAIVTGITRSTDFPTTAGAFNETFNGGNHDAFVTKVSSSGSMLVWSTFLGGTDSDEGIGLALDPSGNVVVAGSTGSSDYPVTPGAYDESCGNCTTGQDGFLTKLSATGSGVIWSTFLGGGDADLPGRDFCFSAALNADGEVVVTGRTEAQDFPTTGGAYDESFNGDWDVFVSKVDSAGTTLIWSTFLGGAVGDEPGLRDGLALDGLGNPLVGGLTSSSDFPTTPGAFDETFNGPGRDGFVTKFSADGSSLLWSTYLGGEESERVQSLKLDSAGNPVVVGETTSCDFPVTADGYDTHNEPPDAFVTKLASSDSGLLWGTYLGGTSSESGYSLALDALDNVVVMGRTVSGDFPTTPGAYDESSNGFFDAFVSKLDMDAPPAPGGHDGGGDFPRGDCPPTDAPDGPWESPSQLHPARPNPFGPVTVIGFELPRTSEITLEVFDVAGRRVRRLIEGFVPAGFHNVPWDGRDDEGQEVASGIYLYRLQEGGRVESRRVVLLR